jgi:FkbM family methyltransferase
MGIKKILRLIRRFLRMENLADLTKSEGKRWSKDKGNDTLRLNYPLNEESLVWDLGGYQGDFADAIYNRYKCHIHVFEPIPEYFQQCVDRFKNNSKIKCFNYGLSDQHGWFDISDGGNASSFVRSLAKGNTKKAELKAIVDVFNKLEIPKIDLIKINIEGGEFDILPALISSEIIKKIAFLQIQFHSFVAGANQKRTQIRDKLEATHTQMWNYNFIWESWKIKQ